MPMTELDQDAETAGLRTRSGDVRDTDAFVSLLYSLLRDGEVCSPALLETLTREITHAASADDRTTLYTNGWLAKYCQDLVARLRLVDDATWRQQAAIPMAATTRCEHGLCSFWYAEAGVNRTIRVEWCKTCGALRMLGGVSLDEDWKLPGRVR